MRRLRPWIALRCLLGVLPLIALCATAQAQQKPEALPEDPNLLLKSASKLFQWEEPAEPMKLVGPIYFVGTKGLSSFLITGHEGHVVIYTGMPGSGLMIEKSIKQLGFNPQDVKLILTGHAHVDHVGGHADLKNATGAKIAMMREEVSLFESGGKRDFHYGAYETFAFEPAQVDQILRDEDVIELGDISITAYLTPGHTQGSTTYVTKVTADGKTYTVIFPDGTSVNPGYRVGPNPSYEGIADDFRKTFRVLGSLRPGIWLTPHTADVGFEAKRARAEQDGAAAWVDPDGYRQWVAAREAKFEKVLKDQTEK